MEKNYPFEQIFEYETCSSTLIEAQNKLPFLSGNALFIAKEQLTGMGRHGNKWLSPRGGLWFTMAIKHLDVPSNFTLFIGKCLHKCIKKFYDSNKLLIKWPNDIYFKHKKLAGIIVQKKLNYLLIGIGINTNSKIPSELKSTAISLKNFTEINNEEFLLAFIDIFQENLDGYFTNGFNENYINRFSFLQGKKITIGTQFAKYEGIVKEINKNGDIVLSLDSGLTQPFFSGTILDFSQ